MTDHRTAETMRARALEAERLLSEATARAERAGAECERLRAERQALMSSATVGAGRDERVIARLREQVETLTREREAAVTERDEARGDHAAVLDAYVDLDRGARSALRCPDDTDVVRWAVRVVEIADGRAPALLEERDRLHTYLARALRGCEKREREAIKADMARETRGE